MASCVRFSVSGSRTEVAVSCLKGESSDISAGKRLACCSRVQNGPEEPLVSWSCSSLTVLNTEGLIVGICIRSGKDDVAESNGLTLGRKR